MSLVGTAVTSGFPEGLDVKGWEYYLEANAYQQHKAVMPLVYKVKNIDTLHYQKSSMIGAGSWQNFGENQTIPIQTPVEGWIIYGKANKWGFMQPVSHEVQKSFQKFDDFLKAQMPEKSQDNIVTKETWAANMFNYGGYTAGSSYFDATVTGLQEDPYPNYIYDGQALYATDGTDDHVNKNGTSYYNGYQLDPTITNLQTVYNRMVVYNSRRENDQKVQIKPDMLVFHPSLLFTMEELMTSSTRPDTANRADNVMKSLLGNSINTVDWFYLDTATHWMFLKSSKNETHPGFIFLEKEVPRFKFWEIPEKEIYVMSGTDAYGAVCANWRYVAASNYSVA